MGIVADVGYYRRVGREFLPPPVEIHPRCSVLQGIREGAGISSCGIIVHPFQCPETCVGLRQCPCAEHVEGGEHSPEILLLVAALQIHVLEQGVSEMPQGRLLAVRKCEQRHNPVPAAHEVRLRKVGVQNLAFKHRDSLRRGLPYYHRAPWFL